MLVPIGYTVRAAVLSVTAGIGLLGAEANAAASNLQAQVTQLSRMSLEELANVEVTSVFKTEQSLGTAPASIYVITREEIIRSGAVSIPEALRLAPNMQVTQLGAREYAITARGFGDKREVQTHANKLLILIDGRSVYSPLFSGVFYDANDVMLDDIERIEVISGPGATLWGANAMNGVINISTRSAKETVGVLTRMAAGDQEQAMDMRYGARIGDRSAFRVYGKAFERGSLELADGTSARDRWSKLQGGWRFEWEDERDALTVQGDAYRANQSLLDASLPGMEISGANALARWVRTTEDSELSVQAYYDHVEREAPPDGAPFKLDTYDLELQHRFNVGTAHRIVWGAGARVNDYQIESIGSLQFEPAHRSLRLGNLFAQDTISLGDSVQLIAGLKLEDNAYSGVTALPDLRLSWAPLDDHMLWLAASRAIRSPTPFDADVVELVGATEFLTGNPDFAAEKLTAYEIGYRTQPDSWLSFSLSAFYNVYDDLRTVELTPVTFIPLRWGNRLEGETYGVEGWANLQVTSWWRLSPGFRTLHKDLQFKPGASGLLDVNQAGNDPGTQAVLKSSMDLGRGLQVDAFFRYVDELPDPKNDSYVELSARVGWRLTNGIELALTGHNLLHSRHTEYAAPTGAYIGRSALFEVRWRQ